MVVRKLIALGKGLEDPKNPLLGPTLKGLYLMGLWQTGSIFRTVSFNILHCSTFVFVVSQFTDLYTVRNDINKVLNNMSLTVLSMIAVAKCFSYVLCQPKWKQLVKEIAEEELRQIRKQDPVVMKLMKKYTIYTRIITYLFWILVSMTIVLLVITPLLKYMSSKKYREEIKAGLEPPPQIMSSWFPFDTSKNPGYLATILVHFVMSWQGSGVIAVFDMNAVSIMSYLKGQLSILRAKSQDIFNGNTRDEVSDRIKECHRHHNVLIKHYKMFNSLLSPTMFLYVLICSITICCSVVQFTSKDATPSQKIWVVQYTTAQVSQLFLYCWHSNEISVEDKKGNQIMSLIGSQSRSLDRGIYESDWWKGDTVLRRQVLLLSGKFTQIFILDAGPYTTLSIPTFIDIMKGSYSFYTVFSQMQND